MRKYNVVILGASGSGKTVYLSALYHKLSTVNVATGYFLSASDHQQKQLNIAYASLLTKWPRANTLTSIDVFEFAVTVKGTEGSNHHAVTIRYHDMAGGRQTHPSEDMKLEQETADVLKDADILLGMIDGERLRRHLKGEGAEHDLWAVDIQALCTQMTKHDPKDKSLHFVLTKWDRYDNKDAALKEARDVLLGYEPFNNVVASCAGTVRLIPVSSVGRECADILNGKANGNARVAPSPINVDVPFACILPDVIGRELRDAEEAARRQEAELQREVVAKLHWWEALGGWLGNAVARVMERRGLQAPAIRWLAEHARRSANQKLMAAAEATDQNRAEAQRLRARVSDETTAIEFVLQSMLNAADEFAGAYPSSKLKEG